MNILKYKESRLPYADEAGIGFGHRTDCPHRLMAFRGDRFVEITEDDTGDSADMKLTSLVEQPKRDIVREMHEAHRITHARDCVHCANEQLELAEKYLLKNLAAVAAEQLEKEILAPMRQFESGATRDTDEGKIDYQGFLSVEVLERYGRYMLRHQRQADGQLRASDNWKKGIPRSAYIKSMYRHMMEVQRLHQEELETLADTVSPQGDFQTKFDEAICALLFNVMGYMYEQEKGR